MEFSYASSPSGPFPFPDMFIVNYAAISTQTTVPTQVCWDEDYRFGFNGMEKDNEAKGQGNRYDFGARIYDSRLGNWLSIDPHAQSYSNASPYSAFANNPLIYIDPNGKDIILAAGMTTKQVLEVLGTLQQLTNDKLVYKTLAYGSRQIKIASLAKSGTETKVDGTRLLRRLNNSDQTVTIQFGTEWQEKDDNSADAVNGVGSDAIVDFAPSHLPDLPVIDASTGEVVDRQSNAVTNFGHELIHAERSMRGEAIDYSEDGTHTYSDGKGGTETNTAPKEELATTGVAYTKPKDITENDLRKEQGKEQRATY